MPPKKEKIKITSLNSAANNDGKGNKIITGGELIDYRDGWRIFKIMSEFVDGYNFLRSLEKEVTIFGSARIPANAVCYKTSEKLGYLLGKAGFTVITGGGPGIMEAANKGAFTSGGQSVGLNIQLPFEQRINPYVKKATAFYYFFTRKVMMTSPANAFVFFPGGFGTMDEFFEVVDAMDIGQMERTPVILVGSEYWKPIISFLKNKSVKEIHSIWEKEIDAWHIVDSAEEAFELIKNVKDRPNWYDDESSPVSENPYQQGRADWRMFKIMAELVESFEFLSNVKNNVAVLGTKSILPNSPYYEAAYETGKILAQNSYTTITGGSSGVMEAVNKGAFESGGVSVGIHTQTESGPHINHYINRAMGFTFPFVRKLTMVSSSKFFIFFPGGLGTMHQLFEILTLIETGKMAPTPVLLYDKNFWEPLIQIINDFYHKFKTISSGDKGLVQIVNSPEEILSYIF